MAFSAVIRRVASSASAAVRFSGGRILRNQTLASTKRRLLPRVYSSRFSTSVATRRNADDTNLLKVIDAEIQCAEECDNHDRVEEIPAGFPFEIQDEKGMNTITLKRTYHDENIEVIVSMPSIVTGDEPDDPPEATNDDGDDVEKPSQSSIPITVNISKGDSPTLEFSCTAYPDEVIIDAMSVREKKESDEEMIAYEGPAFDDLDENLQKAFHKYLELRGISAMTTNFLHEYMINKDSREYLHWLKNVKQFFQK